MFWVMLFLYIGTTVLSGLLAKAPKSAPSALGDLQAPTAEEGRNLTVIFGTCLLKAPNVTWYGDYKTTAIKKSMGIMAFGKKATIGWRYFLGMDLHLCHGQVDELVDIRSGSGEDLKHLNWTRIGTNGDGSAQVKVDDSKCFGGDEKEGGISGTGTFYFGSVTQGSNAYMSAKLGIVYPAYRGISHFVLNQWYLGSSNYIKNIGVVVRRCPSNLGLGAGATNINGDANPAEVIFECLHVKAWALGIPAPRFNVASFQAAAIQLAAEGLGVSLQLDQPHDADATINEVLRHIDGVCYTDPATGLWTLQLVRAVDPATLPEYGPDDVAECEFTRGSWEQTTNEIKVRYIDRATFKEAVTQAHESANYAIRGELASEQVDFLGLSNATIAQRIATREVRTHSYPMGKGRAKLNRKAWALRIGSSFLLTWPALNVNKMAVRVTSVDYGALENGAIEVEFVEDIFNVAYTAYQVPSASRWTDPVGNPQAPAAQLLIECPYAMLGTTGAYVKVLVAASRNDASSTGFEVWADEGAGYHLTVEVDGFTPSGTLVGAYPRTTAALDAAGFTLQSGSDLDTLAGTDAAGRDRGDCLLIFADTAEICAYQGVTDNHDGTYTFTNIVRGVFDTLPADHALGARVFILRDAGAIQVEDYQDGTVLVSSADSGDTILIGD